LAVVALPVGEPGPGNRGPEPVGLGDRPHGHVTPVTPAANGQALGINGKGSHDLIDPSHDVVQVAVAEVLLVGTSERVALTIAAAWIGIKNKVALTREE